MSVNLEWDVPQVLKSPYGIVDFNTPYAMTTDGVSWLFRVMNNDDYSIVPAKLRTVSDSLSQGDGSSIQPPYIDGLVASMTIGYWVCPNGDERAAEPACGEDLRLMNQLLMGVLNGLRNFPQDVSTQQYSWTPTGAAHNRILEGVMLSSWPTPDFTESGDAGGRLVMLKFAIQSPYPYALENNETITPISDGDSATIVNPGNIDQLPVLFVYGPCTEVAVVNESSGFTVSYDSTRPGANAILMGDVLQIDFVEGTCLLNGDVDLNYVAGLDPAATDLWPLAPNGPNTPGGEQVISVAGANIEIISYPAWV